MKRVSFIVPGRPVSKGRPRFQKTNYGVRTYTPKKTVEYENLVKLSFQQQCNGIRLSGQIMAIIKAYFPIPKSTPKKTREKMLRGEILHTKKSDADNIAKSVLDSLNSMAYDDDSQVCILNVVKQYSDNPRVEITLQEVDKSEEIERIFSENM